MKKIIIMAVATAILSGCYSEANRIELARKKTVEEINNCTIGNDGDRQLVKNAITRKDKIHADYIKCVSTWKQSGKSHEDVYNICIDESYKLNNAIYPRSINSVFGYSPSYIGAIEDSLIKCKEI